MTPTVTVRGRAEVRVPPDRAVVTGRLEARGHDRGAALDELRHAQARIGGGIGARVLFEQIRSWSHTDERDRTEHTHTASYRIELDDPGAVAAVVDRLLGLGAEVAHTSWLVADDNPAHRRARAGAVADANRTAADYAAGLGHGLEAIVRVTDGAGGRPEVAPMARMAAAGRGGPELQLEPGTVVVAAEAEVTWTLAPVTADGAADASGAGEG